MHFFIRNVDTTVLCTLYISDHPIYASRTIERWHCGCVFGQHSVGSSDGIGKWALIEGWYAAVGPILFFQRMFDKNGQGVSSILLLRTKLCYQSIQVKYARPSMQKLSKKRMLPLSCGLIPFPVIVVHIIMLWYLCPCQILELQMLQLFRAQAKDSLLI